MKKDIDKKIEEMFLPSLKQAKQRRNITIACVAGSLALIASVGLTVLFIKKRKVNQ